MRSKGCISGVGVILWFALSGFIIMVLLLTSRSVRIRMADFEDFSWSQCLVLPPIIFFKGKHPGGAEDKWEKNDMFNPKAIWRSIDYSVHNKFSVETTVYEARSILKAVICLPCQRKTHYKDEVHDWLILISSGIAGLLMEDYTAKTVTAQRDSEERRPGCDVEACGYCSKSGLVCDYRDYKKDAWNGYVRVRKTLTNIAGEDLILVEGSWDGKSNGGLLSDLI